jgi:arginyl-tRNA synthetase
MATLTIEGLEALLGGLGLKIPIPHFPAADVLNKPLDIGRSYFADILCSLVESDIVNAYGSVTWSTDVYHGDLAAILPKLQHGADPNVLAFDLMQRVWHFLSYHELVSFQTNLIIYISSQHAHFSAFLF